MFATRSNEAELMDDPGADPAELEAALRELELINRTLGGYAPSLAGLLALTPPGARRLEVLDVGTGSGDVARRLVASARARGLELAVTGIDLSEVTVERARARSAGWPELTFARRDLFALPDEPCCDVAHAALVLHHFPGEEAVRALAKMHRVARLGVVINDLHRHAAAWAGIRALTAAFSRSRMVRFDGPLSVRRAFTRPELFELCARAGLPEPEISWHPLFRWSVVIRRTPA